MSSGDVPWIRIGSSLCGKAAGCDQILEAVRCRATTHTAYQANVSEVGCIGMCYEKAEPLMDIMVPGGPRVFYGKMDGTKVPAVIYSHLVRQEPVAELALGYLGEEELPGAKNLWDLPMMKGQMRVALRKCRHNRPM